MTLVETPIARRSQARLMAATRAPVVPQVLTGTFGGALVTLPAAVHGGYFPTSWGWEALMLIALAALALALRTRIHIGRWEMTALAAAAGLLAWMASSTFWTSSATWPLRESERMLVYFAGLLALVLVVRRATYRVLLTGLWVGIVGVCCYGLATRLFPGWQSSFDSFGGYRLSEPIGYWNGLGLLAAIGALLALGMAARGDRVAYAQRLPCHSRS